MWERQFCLLSNIYIHIHILTWMREAYGRGRYISYWNCPLVQHTVINEIRWQFPILICIHQQGRKKNGSAAEARGRYPRDNVPWLSDLQWIGDLFRCIVLFILHNCCCCFCLQTFSLPFQSHNTGGNNFRIIHIHTQKKTINFWWC